MSRKPALRVLLVGLIITLACNFPFQATRSVPLEEFQVTLTALAPTGWDQTPPTTGPGGVIPTSPNEEPEPVGQTDPESTQLRKLELSADGSVYTYFTQSGDTLPAIAKRFDVNPEQVSSDQPLLSEGWLPPGQALVIPNLLGEPSHPEHLLPDSEIVNSLSTVDFNVEEYVASAGGYLNTYTEVVNGRLMSGAEIIEKVAQENSINPRVLLALLEFRSGWVLGQPESSSLVQYPIGFYVPDYKGLYYELVLTATHLGVGYYGWRSGSLTRLAFPDGGTMRIDPGLNPGTAAVQALMAKISKRGEWEESLYDPDGFVSLYQRMYGDPWLQGEPILPFNLSQPPLELPFAAGETWSFTGGPHLSWNSGSPRGALDFSPVTGEAACTTSSAWVTASAAGLVTRSESNVVALDLDGDGNEQTGWVLIYLHIADKESVLPGTWVEVSQPIGHPSCERGNSTGTNVHIARKYNGEWLPADGPVPFVLSGWGVQAGEKSYQGQLVKDERIISANPGGPSSSLITRDE
jgi:LysM repeat protein